MSGLGRDLLRAPFPWFGGKRRVADDVWAILGTCTRYIEPFAGSLGVLLGRPQPFSGLEVINDLDGFVTNAWRSIKFQPEKTAECAIDLISEIDLTAKHIWLVNEGKQTLDRMLADEQWCDPYIAGLWLQGVACWIGTGYCSGKGPWTRDAVLSGIGNDGQGVNRQLPHLGNDGRGVNRQLPHLGDDGKGAGAPSNLNTDGAGVNRQLMHLNTDGAGDWPRLDGCRSYMQALSTRLRDVVIASGDWSRVVTPSAMSARTSGRVGVFLDPPYRSHGNEYGVGDDGVEEVWLGIEKWTRSVDPSVAVVLCGYEGDFVAPDGWTEIAYTAKGTSSDNRDRERFWVSPACRYEEVRLF